MWFLSRVSRLFPLLLCVLLASDTVQPCAAEIRRNEPFEVSPGVRGKVEFWKLIFTKYGEKQLVFHHREYPEIIYSVLDLSELARSVSWKELARKSNIEIEAETKRIRDTLLILADGTPPHTPFQRRVAQLFAHLDGRPSTNYREAADEDEIRYQRGVKERFRESLIRSGRYLPAMERVFERAGLPTELTRLPFIESSFDYTAYSSVGAAGIWQFMRATGHKYMRVDAYIDERRDPIFATRAAAQYLAHAYETLGKWPLAVTSYNHGISGVARGMNETGSSDLADIIRDYDGKAFGFASKNFYAEFVAAVEIEHNYRVYFPGLQREEAWHFDEVRLGRPLAYRDLVRFAGGSSDDVERLNRALMRPIVTGRAKIPAGTVVNVPHGHGQRVVASIGSGDLVSFDRESNLQYSTAPREREAVELARSDGGARSRSARDSSDSPGVFSGKSYRVARGDTIGTIAKKFSLSPDRLRSANHLSNGATLRVGGKLLIPASTERREASESAREPNRKEHPAPATAPPSHAGTYVLQPGETLGSVAHKFGVSTEAIVRANRGLNPKRLRPGKAIALPAHATSEGSAVASAKPESEAVEREQPQPGKKKAAASQARKAARPERTHQVKTYLVKKGDTLDAVAKRVGVSTGKLRELNPKVSSKLKPGARLVVKVD